MSYLWFPIVCLFVLKLNIKIFGIKFWELTFHCNEHRCLFIPEPSIQSFLSALPLVKIDVSLVAGYWGLYWKKWRLSIAWGNDFQISWSCLQVLKAALDLTSVSWRPREECSLRTKIFLYSFPFAKNVSWLNVAVCSCEHNSCLWYNNFILSKTPLLHFGLFSKPSAFWDWEYVTLVPYLFMFRFWDSKILRIICLFYTLRPQRRWKNGWLSLLPLMLQRTCCN